MRKILLPIVPLLAVLLFSTNAISAVQRQAKVTFVKGHAVRIITDSQINKLKLGSMVKGGERVKTGARSSLELELDDGSLIKLGANSDMKIKTLTRETSGTTVALFNLFSGRVKSAVRKLFNSSSKFEYHTKAAIAGVAGTPPFVVEYNPPSKPKEGGVMSVDLLGSTGQAGKLYIKGESSLEKIVLTPGQGSKIIGGKVLPPSPISKRRFNQLTKRDRFVSNKLLNDAARGARTTIDAIDSNKEKPPTTKNQPSAPIAEKIVTQEVQSTISEDIELSPESVSSDEITESSKLADSNQNPVVEDQETNIDIPSTHRDVTIKIQ